MTLLSFLSSRCTKSRFFTALLAVCLVATAAWVAAQGDRVDAPVNKPNTPTRPALTVTVTTPQQADWPQVFSAQGNIVAWQEAVIGSELSGFRLTEVRVDVGDEVRKGQLLARISDETVAADVAQAKASVAEAEAALAEAKANAVRTRDLETKGFVSSHELTQAATSEQTTSARLAAARSRLQAEQVKLAQTRVVAPDDGVISARIATVGSLAQTGQDLFKLIRGNRLEWRAEVTAAEADRLKPGVSATVWLPSGTALKGTVRMVAPTVDPLTRSTLVYVDLPKSATNSPARPGTFVRGEFELSRTGALTVPQSAVLLRDGFSYVFRLDGQNKVTQTKVTVGRRVEDRIEITAGLNPDNRIVAVGAGFLSDGDTVHVVDTAIR